MRKLVSLVVAFVLAGCGGKPAAVPAVAKPPPAAVVDRTPVPCPESILPGGDPLEAPAFEGKPVVRVCVVGGSEASRQAAQKAIELHPSDVFSAERMRADLSAILKLGLFDDASVHGLRVRDGSSVVLLYSLHERPRVADFGFEGAKVLGDATLNARHHVDKETPYEPAKVNAIAIAVRDAYLLKGYDAARVAFVAEPVAGSPDHVRVRMVVDEGPLKVLAKVAFRGSKKVSEAELRKVAGLEAGKPFIREEVERAALVTSALYYERGFVQVRIDTEPGVADAKGAVPVTFVVDEGDAYSFGALHATKLGAQFEKELLEKVVKARPKQLFVRSAVVQDMERVKAFFDAKRQSVAVTPVTEIHADTKTIDLTYEVTPQ